MKQHALCIATAFAVAALGTAGLASARPDGAAPAATAADAARVEAAAERPHRHGKHHPGHRGHRGRAMHGGIERMDADGDGRVSREEFLLFESMFGTTSGMDAGTMPPSGM